MGEEGDYIPVATLSSPECCCIKMGNDESLLSLSRLFFFFFFFAKHIILGRLFKNIHPLFQYSSRLFTDAFKKLFFFLKANILTL